MAKTKKEIDVEIIKKGDILISNPFLCENYFKYSVILIVHFDKNEGCIGLILNKKRNDLYVELGDKQFSVFESGRVQKEQTIILNNLGVKLKDNNIIVDNIGFVNGDESFEKVSEVELMSEKNLKYCVGYCLWEKGQLEEEFICGSWMKTEHEEKIIFCDSGEIMWRKCVEKMGSEYLYLLNLQSDIIID